MKKTLLLAFMACLLATSCEKIVGDLDFLNHDMVLEGDLNPSSGFGVPVAHGSLSIHDILNMVQVTVAKVEVDDESGIITIVYDTAETFKINFEDAKSCKKPSKRRTGIYTDTTHNMIQGSVNIDIFDNIDSTLNGAGMEIDDLFVTLGAYAIADAREDALALMDTFDVMVFYDSLYIVAVGKDGRTFTKKFPTVIIPGDSLILGHRFQLVNREDLSQIINLRPIEIRYGARMNIAFGTDFWESDLSQHDFVADSIGIKSVDINADLKVEFPISAHIKDLSYGTDMHFTMPDLGELSFDSSMLTLHCVNSIPLELGISATLIDSLDRPLGNLIDPSPTVMRGATIKTDGAGRNISDKPSVSDIRIPITAPVWEKLKLTKKIHLDATINTSPTGNPSNKNVAIRASDKLDLSVYAKVKQIYHFETELGGNNNNDGQKGGAR